MVDQYWREIEDIENNIENAMQISSILLKLKGYDDDLEKIDTNENNISTNLGKINTNENNISTNLGKINTNENNISSNLSKVTNIENNLIIVNDIYNETFDIPRFSVTYKDNRIFYRTIYSNFTKNGIIKIDAKYNYVYDKNYTLRHVYRFYNNKKQFKNIILDHDRSAKVINDKFEIQGIDSTKIDIAIYYENNTNSKKIELIGHNTIQINYIENNSKLDISKNNISSNLRKINDNSGLISTNTSDIASNLSLIDTNTSSISDSSDLISTNTSSISDNLSKISTNTFSISSNKGLIETNTSSISSNKGLIETNTSEIASNLEKITALQNSNVKAFYNLDRIFIFDINNGYQTVDKNNHYHIFEKEITYDFTKNSYLEIALKVLTEISHYMLIGFFQILCNFYDQDNNLFYTISLSTAMGSINKLSTVKSVFIVPINENMSKIKIDFFIAPKATQQNRSAIFTIKDINSNKIYIKYFQKTDEMSIKNIQDSLNTVDNITADLEKIDDNIASNLKKINEVDDKIKSKNIKNILFYDEKEQINFKNLFFNKTFELNIKKDDFIEIDLRMLLNYENINESHITITEFKLYDDNNEQLYILTYNNGQSISYSNFVFLNKNIFYNFKKDTKTLKIIIEFRMTKIEVVKIWYEPKNTDRFILKNYGN